MPVNSNIKFALNRLFANCFWGWYDNIINVRSKYAKKKVTEDESSRNGLSAQINAELDKAIDDLTLFDDDLMSKVFDGNIEATELLLQIILSKKLRKDVMLCVNHLQS